MNHVYKSQKCNNKRKVNHAGKYVVARKVLEWQREQRAARRPASDNEKRILDMCGFVDVGEVRDAVRKAAV
jgi:hypothetical protein